jgi:hypothetical protein
VTRALKELSEARARWAERGSNAGDWLPKRADHPNVSLELRMAASEQGQAALWTAGDVVWGWLLLTDRSAWQTGFVGPAYAEVIWSDSPVFERFPGRLEEASTRFWALREHGSGVPGLRALVPFTTVEDRGFIRWRFPNLLSGRHLIHHSSLFLHRDRLPTHVVDSAVPLVRAAGGTPAMVSLLPVPLWPASLRARWEQKADVPR